MHKPSAPASLAAALVAAALTVGTGTGARAAGATLVVDAAAPFRPVTHVASGGLYALAENDRPADSTLLPIKMNTLTQPPPRVGQRPNGQPPGGDGLLVAPQADRVGAGEYLRMPDIYPDFPYKWVSWADWRSRVDTMVTDRLTAGSVSNVAGWEIWNEPDFTWDTAAAGDFNDGWVRTYRQIRDKDALTPIVGPGLSAWNTDRMRSFLTNARDHDALPDVVIWHELNHSSAGVAADVAAYRGLEASLGIGPRPIAINEYAWTDEVDVPGRVTSYIAKFERAGVAVADRAFWHEYGTVNGLVVNNDRPTGTWWLYKWYGDMAGNMITTTPPSQTGLDGLAAYDRTRRIVDVVFGDEGGTNTVKVDGLAELGRAVRVRLETTPASGRFTAVPAPTLISDSVRNTTDGSLTVQVPGMSAGNAYHLTVEPAGGVPAFQQRYEAENASVFRAERLRSPDASEGGYVGGITGSGDPRIDSYLDFIVDVPTARTYTMTIRYAGGGTQGLAVNGGPWSRIHYPPTGGRFATVATRVGLHAGYNVIRLAKGAPGFAGGIGTADLDYLQLT